MVESALLDIKNLSVSFKTREGDFDAVKSISFDIKKGETLALVGESGSGKSVTALSIMQLLPYPLASHSNESSIIFEGDELVNKSKPEKEKGLLHGIQKFFEFFIYLPFLPFIWIYKIFSTKEDLTNHENKMRTVRGSQIGMIFQEPLTALNPLHTIERQIGEMLSLHKGMGKKQAKARIHELMDLVGLSNLKERLNAYPHELSGGQRQRVMIAMALANEPELLIADEPTTALDVTIQAQILELLDDLKTRLGMSLLIITHDLSIVEKMSDRVCIMKNGDIVEQGDTKRIYKAPKHEYTQKLLAARPRGLAKTPANDAPVMLEGTDIQVHFPKKKNFFGTPTDWVRAVDGIDLSVRRGETIGVVGESGSGKTTLGLALIKLQQAKGKIIFSGKDISAYSRKDAKSLRADMQIVFQDPFGSLSPRMSVAQIISEGLKIHKPDLDKDGRDAAVVEALKKVHMDPETRHRYPHEFSGGQRQRISIARALVLSPDLLVLDEPTSALDVSVQAEIVNLLREIQEREQLAYVFISHDLRVVRAMAHKLIVMKDGKVVESGKASDIFDNPKEDYTKTLLEAALNLKTRKSA